MSESDNTAFGDEVYAAGDEDAEFLDQAETLTGDGAETDEPLDTSYSPPDFSPVATRYGNTAAEQAEGESLDQRLAQRLGTFEQAPMEHSADCNYRQIREVPAHLLNEREAVLPGQVEINH